MAQGIMNVNPTRMELKRLKGRLKTAERGHKLLKDKTDEMVRKFIVFAKENKRLREEVEAQLAEALTAFTLARASEDPAYIEEAILMPSKTVRLDCGKKNLMGVSVPTIEISTDNEGETYPYGFASVTGELDTSIDKLNKLAENLIRLSEAEKTCNRLADEIETNKRRVNALEYVMIPQMQETIRYISMKLDEAERSATVRLMKVKSMIAERE